MHRLSLVSTVALSTVALSAASLTACGAFSNTSATAGDETSAGTGGSSGGDPTGGPASEVTIFDLQQSKVAPDTRVTVKDVVVTSPTNFGTNGSATFFIQDPMGGEYSGIQVYVYKDTAAALMMQGKVPKQGDKVTISGDYVEFQAMGAMTPETLSEVNLGSPDDVVITGSATPPTPPVVNAADIATGGAKTENWEGVPVTVQDVDVTNPDLGFGEYEVTGGLRIDNFFLYYAATPDAGTTGLTLTGPLMFGFDNFKLAPRTCDDVVGYDCSAPPDTTGGTSGGPMGSVTIFDIQKGTIPENTVVTVENAVVTSGLTFKKDGFFIQDPMGGEYSGIYVYVGMNPDALMPTPGDVVTVTGLYTEYYTMSQLSASQAGDVMVTGTAAELAPAVVAAADIATGGPKAENYESVLVRVEGVTVATAADNFGEWTVDGGLHVDDLFFAAADWTKPNPGDTFASLTGPLNFSFDNTKISPRSAADLVK